MRTTWLGLVGDGPSGRRNYDKPADEHLPVGQVGTNVDKYGKVSSQGFPWRPIVAILIQLRARSSVSLRSGGSILQSEGGPFFASGEDGAMTRDVLAHQVVPVRYRSSQPLNGRIVKESQ